MFQCRLVPVNAGQSVLFTVGPFGGFSEIIQENIMEGAHLITSTIFAWVLFYSARCYSVYTHT